MAIESLGIPDIMEVEPTTSARRRVSRFLLWIASIAILAAGGYVAYAQVRPAVPPVAPVSTVPVRVDSVAGVVSGSGQIAPWNQAKLSFQSPGKVDMISVRVGDQGRKGDVLARMETTALQSQGEQAKGN